MTADARPATVPVWDRAVRGLHLALAGGTLATWATGQWWHDSHEWLGYGVGGVILLRLAWGFVGSPPARFARFVRGPRSTWAYARAVAGGQALRHLGHNPLGGWMVLALLGCAAATVATGILYTTDWLWGFEWLHRLHQALAWTMLLLVLLHVAGVVFTSLQHRESLVAAMWHGRKRAPAEHDLPA
ncbi:cytochrome b/b6 domain-containing protein [Aquabacterium sp. OR-4]|uniref:cytochrome b/b6 domain-containing protein n=1 Tax=Aquabacterium sp. OR-4 TaxID=2978127 RepID=UPI0021B2CCF8|nr:cytochrome b/b6 domain-containing protein [Aquabacterium sp. OR-4]MDT7834287.1 cytochrome b/b6 domain-containing protein [Aquabacterium sp. OR-4]